MALIIATAVGLVKLLCLLAACVAIEHVAAIERYSLKQRVAGILMNVSAVPLALVLAYPIQILFWHDVQPALIIPLWDWLQPLGWAAYPLQFLTLIVAADFLAYWRHRAEHSKWLWSVHKVHHAPTELHAANNLGHPFQFAFSFVFIVVPMSLIKLDGPGTPLALAMLVTLLSMYIHSPIDFHFGPLRKVLVDNRFHRIHHSLEPRHFDKNFGICFSVWDRMFGTAYEPGNEWPAVGVEGVQPPKTVWQFLVLPFSGLKRPFRPLSPSQTSLSP